MSAPDPLSIIDRYIETCERALPVEEEMAATAPPEREESAQERLDRMQAALAEAKEARVALVDALEAAKALADAVDAETAHLSSFKFLTIAERDEAKQFENRVIEQVEVLRAALARVGGAA